MNLLKLNFNFQILKPSVPGMKIRISKKQFMIKAINMNKIFDAQIVKTSIIEKRLG